MECGGKEKKKQFIIKVCDGKNMLVRRRAVRARHLENMASVKGKAVCAGGLLDDEGKMKGSALITDFESPDLL